MAISANVGQTDAIFLTVGLLGLAVTIASLRTGKALALGGLRLFVRRDERPGEYWVSAVGNGIVFALIPLAAVAQVLL
jgi:hypothetical protein